MEAAVGGDASGLRTAQATERAAIGATITAAADRLASLGRPVSHAAVRRLTETLRAAVVDDAIADQLRRGTLDADQEAPGLGLPGGDLPVETPRPTRADRKSDREDEDRRRQQRARRAELEANLERLERRAHRLRAVADETAARATEARKEADDAETSIEAARRQLAELN
jgi:type IV secretory pathway VirB10-like protein